jgi:Fe2+ or Zn2+ uptake regulation protein
MPKYAEEILSAVWELQRHPTAEQVFLEMKKMHPNIALGTVYKHLNALAEEGQLLRITEPGSPDRYDRTERHDHLICSRCGRISDVRLPDMQGRIQQALGQEILSYDLRIRYICPACREQENKSIVGERQER